KRETSELNGVLIQFPLTSTSDISAKMLAIRPSLVGYHASNSSAQSSSACQQRPNAPEDCVSVIKRVTGLSGCCRLFCIALRNTSGAASENDRRKPETESQRSSSALDRS